jgi:transcriptional regulator with XRE-family HTH domain
MFTVPDGAVVRKIMGGRIRTMRHRRGLTQAQLAEYAGVGQSWIARVELGQVRASPEQLRVICQTLQVSADALLGL